MVLGYLYRITSVFLLAQTGFLLSEAMGLSGFLWIPQYSILVWAGNQKFLAFDNILIGPDSYFKAFLK